MPSTAIGGTQREIKRGHYHKGTKTLRKALGYFFFFFCLCALVSWWLEKVLFNFINLVDKQMIGKKISHYKISDKLGEGGMGVVYKAEDTKLERPVALKFLSPSSLGTEEDMIRFIREAKTAAALDHPNICTVHEIDEAEGQTFIAMAFVEGQSLEERVESGPLEIQEAVDIAIQIAEGLKEAHRKGIIHRDIKSANIMVTEDGKAKIMDFGLAKLAGRTRLTKTATIMGTVAYMSPEQASGEATIDHRTDIWSLGVVLYRMLTGNLAFDAPTDAALIHKIIYEEPGPISSLRSDIPSGLEDAIRKMLKKNPQDRYQDMQSLISDLQSVKSRMVTVTAEPAPSIAVLPFANMSADPDQEYFCDGLAEEIINALTQLKDLHVVARTSAFSFKGEKMDVREIGRKLNVATVLEGSVRKAGNRLRITGQLVKVADGYHLWSERFDRELDDIFAIQDEITLAIVDRLRPKLFGKEKAALARRQTVNIEAYNLYLQGRWFQSQSTSEGLKKAIDYFEQAIEREPDYAPAYAGLCDSYYTLPFYGAYAPKQVLPKAREAALKALQLDDTLADAHRSLGGIKSSYDWDWEAGEREFKRAIELNPGHAPSHHAYAFLLMYVGRHAEAIKEIERALELDPLALLISRDAGVILGYANEPDKAISVLRRTLEMNPGYPAAHVLLGLAYMKKSMYDEALTECELEMEGADGLNTLAQARIGLIYALTDRRDDCRRIREDLIERSNREYVPPFLLAGLSLALGETDRGFDLLDKAYEEKDPFLCYLKGDSLASDALNVRSDPRYLALLKKMGLDK